MDSQPQGTLSTVRVNQGHSLDCSDLIVDCTNLFRLGDRAAGAAVGRKNLSDRRCLCEVIPPWLLVCMLCWTSVKAKW